MSESPFVLTFQGLDFEISFLYAFLDQNREYGISDREKTLCEMSKTPQ
jgi:hypothetical protein